MLVFAKGAEVALHATADARVVLIGGAPIDGERHIWWNFVSSADNSIGIPRPATDRMTGAPVDRP